MIYLNGNTPKVKVTITTGKGVVTHRLTTDGNENCTGYFGAVPTSYSAHLNRRMWISKTRGGDPISKNADVKGNEIKLSFTQGRPSNRSQVKLEPNSTYYLNHSQHKVGAGPGPTDLSAFFRSVSIKEG